MPVLKNARHETFAQGLAKGQTADEAYQKAGFKPNRGNAATLKANQSILDRVSEIQGKAAAKAGVSIQSLTDELEQARGIAIAEKQSSAAVAATMGKAKLHGLGVEHKRVSGSFQLITLTQEQIGKLTPDERTALAAALPVLEKLGAFAEDADDSGTTGD
ncbi:hypothetical protein [Agrobacterium tumefaciens]|uniref:hypothetical protein n=1 Tax=Agrobacterium tumefaciens TaxID=358 RepID=UPI0021D2A171|nr:hypothetical protein [Agrobacterium tumefaciens]UXT27223.1 hypothetical protein FY139_16710 [Agrobacterium tumefaciens]UXT33171.1 hypothetical protein FY138_07035 [Agrobacterium tumefaciens]